MFKAESRPVSLPDELSIYWWRLVIFATRRLHRVKRRAVPIVSPMVPFLWIPVLALVCGMLIGWVIAIA